MNKTWLNFSKEHKVALTFLFFSFLLYLVLFFASTYVSKPIVEKAKTVIIPTKDAPLYDMKGEVEHKDKVIKKLSYSFQFPSTLVREIKDQGKSVLFYYDGSIVAKLTFIYQGQNGLSKDKYVKDVIGQRIPLAIGSLSTIFGNYEYLTAAGENSYFRVASFKKGEWLGTFEILPDNGEVEKIILGSLQVK
jgi:hypothetical protein